MFCCSLMCTALPLSQCRLQVLSPWCPFSVTKLGGRQGDCEKGWEVGASLAGSRNTASSQLARPAIFVFVAAGALGNSILGCKHGNLCNLPAKCAHPLRSSNGRGKGMAQA